jgi:ribonuclease Z
MVQFDCGEGVQVAFKELRLGIKPLSVIAITHLHADHCLGLPGVLMFRAQCDEPGPLVVLGPKGIGRFVRNVVADLSCHITFDVEVREWSTKSEAVAYEDQEFSIQWAPLRHGVTCLGYRLEEHQRPGRFAPERARELGLPQGPLWGALQRGESVTAPDGRLVQPSEVLGAPRRGRAVAYCTDTAPCPNLAELCREVDLAFIEGMFMPEHEEEGRKKQHLTADQAVTTTLQAGAQRTVLVHLSPRYGPAELRHMGQLAKQKNPTARVGRDLEVYDVPLPD